MKNEFFDEEIVVLDFETTGLSADYERIIEVGAVIVKGDRIKKSFSSLCNPGYRISSFITDLTGITNKMLSGQPTPESVMPEFYKFIGNRPILAHNASFDTKFLAAEMARIGKTIENPIACTMLLARRLIPDLYDYKLGTLKRYLKFRESSDHKDHRALDDVKVTVNLWIHLRNIVDEMVGEEHLDFQLFQKLCRMSKAKIASFKEKYSIQCAGSSK